MNNFILQLIASLNKTQSKRQIKADMKSLGDLYVKLIGNLDMPKTRKVIKAQLKGLNNMTFNITPNANTKGVQTATKQAINNAQRVANSNKVHLNFDTNKQQLINQIKILGRNNNKLFSDQNMTAKYNQLLNSASVAKSTGELKTLRGELSAFKTELVATNNAGLTWGSKFKQSISSYAKFFSGASMVYALTNQLRTAATEAKTLDDSLVDLQKVTDEIADRDALYKYFDKSMSKAQELNVKVSSLIDAVTEFKKLGWSLNDAELGAEWANILTNVGDVDIETAIGSIKTSIASFDEIGGYGNDQMDKKLEAYTDLINNMSNKYSIDAEGLAESIRLSAGTLTEAHTSIEQAATMFATANKYYNDPSYLGNTAKIGSLRMRASTGDTSAIEELQEMGEEVDDLATATSNLREKLIALTGVDIMVDDHTFKSYYDQLYEISQVMNRLDDTSRANVLETLFGKSRSAAGAAILSGMKESASAYEDAINSAGSATQEYQTWMTSADAACQRFSNTLTQTYQSIINGNTVRDLANLGSAILEFANNWGIVEGTLKGVIALNIGKFLTTGTMALITATKQVEQYGQALQMASNVPNGNLSARFQTLKSIADATSSLTTEQLRNVLATQTLTQADRIRILQMQGMTKEMALQKLVEMNLTQATNAQTAANTASTASTFSLKAAMTGLGATLKSVFLNNQVGIILMGISLGVSAVTSAVSKHNQAVEEARQKAQEAADTFSNQASSIDEAVEKYQELHTALLKAKGNEEETATVKSQLLDLQKQLNEQFGDEYGKLNLVTDAYKDQTDAIKAYSKEAANAYLNKNRSQINKAKKKMTEDSSYVVASGFYSSKSFAKSYDSPSAKYYDTIENLASQYDITMDDYGNLSYVGNVQEADTAINNFMTALRELQTQLDETDTATNALFNGILKDSENSLGDAKSIIDEYGDIYQQSQLAEIASDDVLSDEYNRLASAVDEYNNAVSNSDNPYEDSSVKDAYDNLQAIKTEISDNSAWDNYRDVVDKTFNEADTKSYDFYNSIKNNEDGIGDLANKLNGLSMTDIQSMIDDGDNGDDFDILSKKAEEAGISIEELIDILKKLGIIIDNSTTSDIENSFSLPDTDTLQQQISDLNSAIDAIQSAYDTLNSAVEEYNTNGGTLSIDTIQSLLSLSDEYLACLQVENGQLSLNSEAMAQLAQAKLDEAQATAVTQAMTELQAIANGEAAQSTTSYISGNAALMESLAQLNGSYEGVAQAAMTAAQAQELSAQISAAASKDKTATQNVMKGLDNKLKLIQATKATISAGNFAKVAGKSSGSGSKGSSGKSASDTAKEEIESYMEYLEKALEGGRITYNDYVRDVTLKLDDMYHKGRISAKEYFDYVEKRLEQQLNVYKAALSAVTDLLDDAVQEWQDKIDAINDENDALEKQKDDYDSILSAVDDVYQKEIDRLNEQKDLLQDKIDAINDENDALDLQRKKQEALIALDKSIKQRNVKIYTEGRGYFYDIDRDAYKEAQENLQDVKNEEVIKKLQDEQDALDDSIELLEKYRDLWNDIADAYKKKTNEALAVALWGENYEKIILQNRTQDIEAFKDKYLEIQAKIDDNKSLIDSYQEKVDYYNQLKEQWNDISSAYEKEQQRMYAAQILGANWEKDVLDGRLDVLNQFRDAYIDIQRQMTQAALDGAKARNAAASSESGGSGGSSGGGGSTAQSQPSKAYHVVHLVGSGYKTSGEASSKIGSTPGGEGVVQHSDGLWYVYKKEKYSALDFSSKSDANDYIKKQLSPAGKYAIRYYHTGLENGLVASNKTDSDFEILKKYGLKKYEVPTILKEGEAVLNQEQIKNLALALKTIPTASSLYKAQDYTKMLPNLKSNNTPVMVTQSINVTLPNVTNNTGYENLTRELNRLKLDAYQFANRRN